MTAAADYAAQTFGHLDVLINNASGTVDFAALSALDADPAAVQSALDIDVLGPWQLTQLVLTLLKAAPAHSFAKYALNTLTGVLATALRDTPILVNAVDPGETATHPERGDEDTARPALESARGVVWAATLPPGGPTGGLFRDGQWCCPCFPERKTPRARTVTGPGPQRENPYYARISDPGAGCPGARCSRATRGRPPRRAGGSGPR